MLRKNQQQHKRREDSSFRSVIRGGQLFFHKWSMLRQVNRKTIGFLMSMTSLLSLVLFIYSSTLYEKYIVVKYAQSSIFYMKGSPTYTTLHFPPSDNECQLCGKVYRTTYKQILNSKYAVDKVNNLIHDLIFSVLSSIAIVGIGLFLFLIYFFKVGKKEIDEIFLRGNSRENVDTVRKALRKNNLLHPKYSLGSIPFVVESENRNIYILGSQGTGKSMTLKHLLKSIRQAGDRALVYSTKGEFVQAFYDPSKDKLLMPYDKRNSGWNIYDEIYESYHLDDVVNNLIEEEEGDNNSYFTHSARNVLKAFLVKESGIARDEGRRPSIKNIINVLDGSREGIDKYLKDTPASEYISADSKTAGSNIITTLKNYLAPLWEVHDQGEDCLSIRQWALDEIGTDGQWIHIPSKPDVKEAIRPILSLWIAIFISSVLSLPDNRKRRIWLILDELPSLNKMKDLENLMGQCRSKGVCVVLGAQAQSQLVSRYGETSRVSETLASLCATHVIFRLNDHWNSEWAEKLLGQMEMEDTKESSGFGTHEMRDSQSLNVDVKQKVLVTASEIQNIDDLFGFAKLKGDIPTVEFKQAILDLPDIAEEFIPNDFSLYANVVQQGIKKRKQFKANNNDSDTDNLINRDTSLEQRM